MWYKNLVNSKIDGLIPLLSLFGNEEEFVDHFIRNVKFFKPEDVRIHSLCLLESINKGDKIPVRYSMKTREYFRYNNANVGRSFSVKSFKNKDDAKVFAENEDYFHSETGVKVCIDKDGNYFVRKAIFDSVRLRVSQGAINDIHNYVISHIWGKTENPYFFTSLWNVTLIPNYLSFILDKPDENSEMVKKIKLLFRALCYRLYKPNDLIGKKIVDEEDFKDYIEQADKFVTGGCITYVAANELTEVRIKVEAEEEVEDPYDIWEELRRIEKNKEFILLTLEKLRPTKLDFVSHFQDKAKCREICKLSYPILVDVTDHAEDKVRGKIRPVNSDVYYAKTYFEYKSKVYLICNDWHTENREMLIEWLTGIQN